MASTGRGFLLMGVGASDVATCCFGDVGSVSIGAGAGGGGPGARLERVPGVDELVPRRRRPRGDYFLDFGSISAPEVLEAVGRHQNFRAVDAIAHVRAEPPLQLEGVWNRPSVCPFRLRRKWGLFVNSEAAAPCSFAWLRRL